MPSMEKTGGFPYYPMFLNISGRRCVVVGGGRVALRKVNALLESGADIEIISPDLCSELRTLSEQGQVSMLRRSYQPGDLKKAFIAIAATDNREINHQVVEEARSRAVLVNVVDDPENSDFTVPSYGRRGDVTIAVSTAGRSPALARKIRTRLEKELGDEYTALVQLVEEVRTEIRRLGIKATGSDWQEALDLDSIVAILKRGDTEKARAALLGSLKSKQKQGKA